MHNNFTAAVFVLLIVAGQTNYCLNKASKLLILHNKIIIMKKGLLFIFTIVLLSTTVFAQKINTYAVVVSFNSMCCGVPDNTPVKKLIRNFKKQYKIKSMSVDSIGPMGREGEYYLAFRLKELSKSQKIKFVQQLKKIAPSMKDKGSAEIKENVVVDKADLSSRTTISTLKF